MTTEAGARIRLVKCPRCRKILPESPEVSMYKCGWCGIILQAKTRKPEIIQTQSSSQESAQSRQENVLGQTEDRNSNDDLTDATKIGFSPDGGQIQCQDECDDSLEIFHNRGASDGVSSSPEITSPWNESSPLEYLGNNPGPERYRCKSNDHGEWSAGTSSSKVVCNSSEISLQAKTYSSEACEHGEKLKPSQLHGDLSVEEKHDGESQEEGNHLVDEVPEYEDEESILPERAEDNYFRPENDETSLTSSANQNGEIKHVEPDSPPGIISHEKDIISPSSEFVDEGSKDRSFITDRRMTPNPSKGSLVSFYLTSDDEQQDHSPIDTMGSSHYGDLSPELNLGAGFTETSRNYYAYDGSESSYDGIDDDVHEHPSRKDKDIKELSRDRLSGNNMLNNETEGNYWGTSPSHRAMHLPSSRKRMGLYVQEDVSRLPFHSRDHHITARRPATFSGHRHNLPPPHPDFNLSNNSASACSNPDKIHLLRTVYQLTDQLQRMQFPEVMPNRRFPEGHFTPVSYNFLASERDINDAGRFNQRAKGCGERFNDPRIAFSAHFRHQASCSCLQCCQDWHYSAQLPWCCKNGHCMIHTNSLRYGSSEPSSSQSDNQRHGEIHFGETTKRHLLPIAGGAPVIACYHCSEVLQLPVDFLLFKKRYHKLMCNACRKVLKFSFLKGTSGRRNLKPIPRSSSALSCSDDYGRSSCSTERAEASVVLPRDSYKTKMSMSSYDPVVDRKLKGRSETE